MRFSPEFTALLAKRTQHLKKWSRSIECGECFRIGNNVSIIRGSIMAKLPISKGIRSSAQVHVELQIEP